MEVYMNYYLRFPEGRLRAVTLSYDDGVVQDERFLDIINRYGIKGRVQFNVGGAQVNEDMLKLIRNYTKKPRMFAFMGGYHGRTIGTTAVTSSYRYREHFGHMSDTAHFVPFPYCF